MGVGSKRAAAPLTEGQRRLVRENVGLVSVHLRRFVANLSHPRRDREWDDLFQEGCLGLMRAAVLFRPEAGIPFAAFALPRIHNAVSRALHIRFSTVYVPPKRRAARDAPPTPVDHRPKVHQLSPEHEQRLPSRGTRPVDGATLETVGERVREKYVRAVRAVSIELASRTSRRGDRDRLVRVLVDERFLVPHDEAKTALRRIARDTHSSYARVAQCDKTLAEAIRARLELDPEFVDLQRRMRADPEGGDRPIDDDLEGRLTRTSAEAFAARYRRARPYEQAVALARLLTLSNRDMADWVGRRVAVLPPAVRERLWTDTEDSQTHSSAKANSPCHSRVSSGTKDRDRSAGA